MAAGYSIGVASDTKEFSEGIANGVVKPLQDAADTIAALADTSDGASDKITAALRAEQSATEKNSAANKAASESAVQGYREVQESAELSVGEINRVQKEGVKTGASAISQIVSQSAQGFDGTAQGALNSLTNLSAGIAAFGGPEIAAVGGAIALFSSLIGGALQKAQDDAKAAAATVDSLTTELEKAGVKGEESFDSISAQLKVMAHQTDDTATSLTNLASENAKAGTSFDQSADAIAGNVPLLKELVAQTNAKIKADDAEVAASGKSSHARHQAAEDIKTQEDATKSLNATYKAQLDSQDKAEAKVRLETQARNALISTIEGQAITERSLAATQTQTSDIGSTLASEQEKYDDAATASSEKSKKTVVANNAYTFANILQTQQDELTALQNTKANEIEIYEKFGTDAGAAIIKSAKGNPSLLAAYTTATPAEVSQYLAGNAAYGKLGAESASKAAAAALAAQSIPGPRITDPTINTELLLKNAQSQINKTPLTVQVQAILGGKRVI